MAKRPSKKTEARKPRKRARNPAPKLVAPKIIEGLVELTVALESEANERVPSEPAAEVVHVPDLATPVLSNDVVVAYGMDLSTVEKPWPCERDSQELKSRIDAIDAAYDNTPLWWIVLGVAIIVGVLVLVNSCGQANGAEPIDPYAAARTQALESGKPLVVLLESDDCGPCKQLVKDCGVQIRAKGVFVDLNWERDRLTIDRIVPRGRVIVPTVIVWRRGIGGNWVKVELRGAGEIREWAKGEKR